MVKNEKAFVQSTAGWEDALEQLPSDVLGEAGTELIKEFARLRAAEAELLATRRVLAVLVSRAGGEVRIERAAIQDLEPNTTLECLSPDELGPGRHDILLRVVR